MKTWHYEILVVGVILSLVTLLFQNNKINWLTTVAILLTFNHAQIGDRLQEGQKQMTNPDVKCYWKLNILFVLKEIVWVLVFLLIHNYAAIVGCILFALYPVWRKIYRKYHPRRQSVFEEIRTIDFIKEVNEQQKN